MPSINVLPDLLVNKIAAGEVIERPASVVKELVENSLDAGAKRIHVDIEQGGRKLIRIVDDGGGMGADDLARCILPHATSKIRSEDDLFAIRTMGFRGEALPSIGSVSQLRLLSRLADANEACEIRMTADRVEPAVVAAGPPGTTVEVRELFFNVPARQKFLRTAQTEMGHITEQIARVALACTSVEFKLTHNGRLVHHLRPADNMRMRIADLFGTDLAANLIEFSRSERGLAIRGFVGHPNDSRSSAKWQYIFLNGRYIRDRFVSHATREAYRGLMEANRYPVFFIAMEIDPACVDVNVHPTKAEVRWQDSNIVYSQVLSALRDRFLSADLSATYRTGKAGATPTMGDEGATPECTGTPPAGLTLPTGDPADAEADEELQAQRRLEVRRSIADFFKQNTPEKGVRSLFPKRPEGFTASWPERHAANRLEPLEEFPRKKASDPFFGGGSVAGPRHTLQVHRCYLVTETEDGLLIVDQHALHERVLYEQISGQLACGRLESQRLLLPETLDVTPEYLALIETHGALFEQLGFELSPYGPNTIAAHATPSLLRPERVVDFLRDVLDRLADRQSPASAELLMDAMISMMACKAAVKAGDVLTAEEIDALMAQREHVERSTNCPHGRPTSLNLTLRDLEKQFKRT